MRITRYRLEVLERAIEIATDREIILSKEWNIFSPVKRVQYKTNWAAVGALDYETVKAFSNKLLFVNEIANFINTLDLEEAPYSSEDTLINSRETYKENVDKLVDAIEYSGFQIDIFKKDLCGYLSK